MKLTDGEKLMLLMLCEIYEKLGVEGETDPKFIQRAIFTENTWGINWLYTGIPFESDDAPPEVHEVLNILEMWRSIEDTYSELSKDDRAIVEKEAGGKPRFTGFDGNKEGSHGNIADFLINYLDRFEEFKGRTLNSHVPLLDAYRRMLGAFRPMKSDSTRGFLRMDQLIELLREQVHPDNG